MRNSSNAARMTKCLGVRMLLGCTLLLWTACGRTALLPRCSIEVSPATLDFGPVAVGGLATMSIAVADRGRDACQISSVGLDPSSDASFSIGPQASASLVVNPGESATVAVTFAPTSASVPLLRGGTLVLQTSDSLHPRVEVPLAGTIRTNCTIVVSPLAVDFGQVPIDSNQTSGVLVANTGSGPCEIAGIAIAPDSDPQFALGSGQASSFTLAPGDQQSIVLAFNATDPAAPHHRAGNLAFESTDAKHATVTIPLSADIDLGCMLTVAPSSLDFGNVILNTSASRTVTLVNLGTEACQVSGVGFGPGTDPGFTLAPAQALAFTVAPGAQQTIDVNFGAFNSAPPHVLTGTLNLEVANSRAPGVSSPLTIPLTVTVATACSEASQWIYTVDSDGTLSRFDPATLTFTDIAWLNCPSPPNQEPFSMALDQNAVAWVVYADLEDEPNDPLFEPATLYKVDTGTAQCQQATSFQVDANGPFAQGFGMGFVFDPSANLDTLYIAGGNGTSAGPSELATVSFPSLAVTPIGPIAAGNAELTGTGDGSLWGFIPASMGPDPNSPAVLVQIDPASGATLESYSYPTLFGANSWAVKFWGGSFWIFLNGAVYEVPRATPQTVLLRIADTGRNIVGAGVSTCAPLF
jgi:Abnormal spindle-like microcephaly-assoc'd, ASPM-SPD-2-Hydin